jgi:hypothetical protein
MRTRVLIKLVLDFRLGRDLYDSVHALWRFCPNGQVVPWMGRRSMSRAPASHWRTVSALAGAAGVLRTALHKCTKGLSLASPPHHFCRCPRRSLWSQPWHCWEQCHRTDRQCANNPPLAALTIACSPSEAQASDCEHVAAHSTLDRCRGSVLVVNCSASGPSTARQGPSQKQYHKVYAWRAGTTPWFVCHRGRSRARPANPDATSSTESQGNNAHYVDRSTSSPS